MSLKMSFTLEEDLLLAECVSKYPCLYDQKNEEYKDSRIKDDVWKKISNILNKSVDDCKKRWKNMKDTYNKNKKCRKLGTGSFSKNKQTKWALAGALSFIDVCSYEGERPTNFKSTNEMNDSEEEDSLILTLKDENNSNDVNNFLSIYSTKPTMEHPEPENVLETKKTKLFKEKQPIKKTKQNEELMTLNRSNDERQKILNVIVKDKKDEDPTDVFFKTMALTVKSFPQYLKIKAKKEVFNIITNLEIENCNTTSTSNKSIQSTNSLFSSPNPSK